MATKHVVADLNKGDKLDGTNYDMWHRKIQYLLNEQEVLENLTHSLEPPAGNPPAEGETNQYSHDMEAYEVWQKKDRSARFTMLSSMCDDLIGAFESYTTAREMWEQLKVSFGGTSTTRVRALTLKFEQYVMDPKHSMAEHLRMMASLIRNLKAAGNNLSDEQQVTAVIHSLPEPTWGHVKTVLTHNENIKTFADISRHLELAAERLDVNRGTLLVAHGGPSKMSNCKGKGKNKLKDDDKLKPKGNKIGKHRRGKRGGKKDKAKMKCYNCEKLGHFARECTEPKKERQNM